MSAPPAANSLDSGSGLSADERDFNTLWNDALQAYEEQTKHKLPIADGSLPESSTEGEVIDYIELQARSFEAFRANGRRVRGVLQPIVNLVLLFVDAGAEAGAAYDVKPGGKAIFLAIAVLLKATKGVSELYNSVEDLLQEVTGHLERIKIHFEPPRTPLATLKNIVLKALIQVLKVLAIATKYCDLVMEGKPWYGNLGRTIVRRTKDYFTMFVNKADVQEILKELRALTKKEEQMVIAATYADGRETKASVTIVKSDVEVVKQEVDFIHNNIVIDNLRSWLRPPYQQPSNYEKKRQYGSCEWFFYDSGFKDWKAHGNAVYWVYGNAGAGKSVLCSSVLDTLKVDPALSLAYFYFDFSDRDKQDCRALVSSLVFQLGTSSAACMTYLKDERQRYSDSSPTYDELLDLLSHLLSLSIRPFIVIDALDECPKEARDGTGLGPTKGLLGFLKHLCGLHRDRNDFHLFATSRREPNIEYYLDPLATHRLGLHDNDEHNTELSRYIFTQLSDERLYHWSKDNTIKAKAGKILIKKSGGMFLWVNLQLRRLQFRAPRYVEQVLETLPPGLDETYKQILENFSSERDMIDRARHVLECVAFAQQPFSLSEAVTIVFVNFDSPIDEPVELDAEPDITNLGMYLLERCPGLLAYNAAVILV
ncbi:hypothetical protein PENSPDRAFT_693837 [Peniophora sp. CONT]|nr:hypothetical protein PENSPDRAFT_693837 [Peniophora sp. CONT]